MIVAVLHLLACIVILAISDYVGVEMWLVCFISAISLSIFDLVYDLIKFKTARPMLKSLSKEPYELVPFVLSMFVIVLALKNSGAIDILNKTLIGGNLFDGLSIGFLSAAAANLLNNIPMSVMFESIIGQSSYPAVFGAIIGSNVGAFITPVGALAGIMWSKILGNYGVKFPFRKFVTYGTAIAIPTLVTSLGGLLITLAL
jgi:arsenical pump membrane protein